MVFCLTGTGAAAKQAHEGSINSKPKEYVKFTKTFSTSIVHPCLLSSTK
jgi:hypothetical protein